MSKIEFPFAAVAKLFGHKDIIDISNEKNHKKLVFAFWSISKCYTKPQLHNGELYDAYEFSCTYEEIAESLGISYSQARSIVMYFQEIGWLIKSNNQIANRSNRFKWDKEKFKCEKVIILQDNEEVELNKIADQNQQENDVHNSKKSQNDLRVKIMKKSQTKSNLKNNFKEDKNRRSTQKIADQIAERFTSENHEKIADQKATSIETIEVLCLKETNINKEKDAIPIVGKDLSLFSDEKDLFIAAKENELAEHQKALEAYVSYRDISNVTSKTIARWLTTYSKDDIISAIGMMLSQRVENPGGWIENALQKGLVHQENRKNQNIQFAKQMQPKNKYLRINSRYCKDIRFKDREFYYHIDPKIFQSELRKCL